MRDAKAIYATAGGQSPQQYVATACSEIANGRADIIVLCGSEAIATMRAHQRSGETLDWSESPEGTSEDHGMGLEDQFVPALAAHKVVAPIDIYPMMEHKKRASRGMSRADYLAYLGDVLTPLANAARVNPFTMFENVPESQEIAAISGRNRVVGDPHLKSMVAKDGVNQSSAVVVMQYGMACELGLEQRAVFLTGFAEATEQNLLDRVDWSTSPALRWTYASALSAAGMRADEIDAFDIYSCFPVAVIEAMEALGLELGDERPVSLTGVCLSSAVRAITIPCMALRPLSQLFRTGNTQMCLLVLWVVTCQSMPSAFTVGHRVPLIRGRTRCDLKVLEIVGRLPQNSAAARSSRHS